jgi:PIN domain nuclease of toxin-antitoxin system
VSRNRVVLSRPMAQCTREAVSAPGLSIEPLSPQIAVEACSLPEAFQRGPADRLIVATARVANATLITRDRRILDYAARGHLSAMTA